MKKATQLFVAFTFLMLSGNAQNKRLSSLYTGYEYRSSYSFHSAHVGIELSPAKKYGMIMHVGGIGTKNGKGLSLQLKALRYFSSQKLFNLYSGCFFAAPLKRQKKGKNQTKKRASFGIPLGVKYSKLKYLDLRMETGLEFIIAHFSPATAPYGNLSFGYKF